MTKDYDITCLTETHIDQTIDSKYLLETPGLVLFRHDRNLHGGGVLIATKSYLEASTLDIDTVGEEIVIVKIPTNLIICCYYRSHVSSPNIQNLSKTLNTVLTKHPQCKLILLGDMNLPVLDWQNVTVQHNAQYKSLHLQYVSMLHENNMNQVIKEPTHILGNTLNLICVNDQNIIKSPTVVMRA